MNGKERKQEIFAMFAEGRTYAEIGRIFSISRQRVQQIVRPPIQVMDALRRRAGRKCERCRIPLRGGDEHVHHIDNHVTGRYDDLKRVRLLCRSCHKIEDYKKAPHKWSKSGRKRVKEVAA